MGNKLRDDRKDAPFKSFHVLLGCQELHGLEAWYAALQTLAMWRPDLYQYLAGVDVECIPGSLVIHLEYPRPIHIAMPADCSQSTLEQWLHAYVTGMAFDEHGKDIEQILESADQQIDAVRAIAKRNNLPEFCAFPTYGRQVVDVIEQCRARLFPFLVDAGALVAFA